MVDIIVTGHGNFASGILSCSALIMGEQDNVFGVDFTEGMSSETLLEALQRVVGLASKDILILADLAGGTPFNMAVQLSLSETEKHIHVVAGTNAAMLLDILQCRNLSLRELAAEALQAGNTGLQEFCMPSRKQAVEDAEDGI